MHDRRQAGPASLWDTWGAAVRVRFEKSFADDVERIELFIAHSLPDTVRAIVLPLIILGYLFFMD